MNRWIAALAMGLATAANAPAAAPSAFPQEGASAVPARGGNGIVSSAEAASPGSAAHAQPAGFVMDRHASLTTADAGDSLASSGPDPVVAWMLAAGFLGIVVMRRTRDTQGY